MKYFLSESSFKALTNLSDEKTLFAFDFDGTLAKIVPEPKAAFMNQKTEALLRKLSENSVVAVISGRSRKDLVSRLPKNIPFTIGNHGIEGLRSLAFKIQNVKKLTKHWKSQIEKSLENTFFSGVEIEDKTYSLTLHYRGCENKTAAKNELLRVVGMLDDSPRIIFGKNVFNILPMGAPHKGMALLELMLETGASKALYVGDDDTDEDIFSLPDDRIISVRIGKKSISQAKYYLNRQSEITVLLRKLLQLQDLSKRRDRYDEGALL